MSMPPLVKRARKVLRAVNAAASPEVRGLLLVLLGTTLRVEHESKKTRQSACKDSQSKTADSYLCRNTL